MDSVLYLAIIAYGLLEWGIASRRYGWPLFLAVFACPTLIAAAAPLIYPATRAVLIEPISPAGPGQIPIVVFVLVLGGALIANTPRTLKSWGTTWKSWH